jgi:translation initiation factor 4A
MASFESFDQIECLCKNNGELLNGIYSYGFEKPSYIQSKTIIPIYEGKDIIVQSQSGTGKTGAFCIGVLAKIDVTKPSPQCIIIANTRELATQNYIVISNISCQMSVKITLCIGGGGCSDVKTNINCARNSHILVGTPGRLKDIILRDQNSTFANKITDSVRMLIFDEADVLLQSDFVDQIKNIFTYTPEGTQICIFSATFPTEVVNLTKKFMKDPVKILLEQEKISLEQIKHYFIEVENEKEKYEILSEMYKNINISQTIIFVNSIFTANVVYEQLTSDGHAVGVIHAKLDDVARMNVLKDFRNTRIRVLIATDVLARGIDVQNVGIIINYDLSKDLDQYIHRVGRSGRYGKIGIAINFLLKNKSDFKQLKLIENTYKIIIDEMPELKYINSLLTGSHEFT